jgi:hypothetical protein
VGHRAIIYKTNIVFRICLKKRSKIQIYPKDKIILFECWDLDKIEFLRKSIIPLDELKLCEI